MKNVVQADEMMMIAALEKLEDDSDLQSKKIQSEFTKHPASGHLISSEQHEEEGLQLYKPLSSDH